MIRLIKHETIFHFQRSSRRLLVVFSQVQGVYSQPSMSSFATRTRNVKLSTLYTSSPHSGKSGQLLQISSQSKIISFVQAVTSETQVAFVNDAEEVYCNEM